MHYCRSEFDKRMELNCWRRFLRKSGLRSEGHTMFRRSPCRTFEAIVTQTIALIVGLAGSDLKRFVTKQPKSKNIELLGSHDIARGDTFLPCEVAALIEVAAAAK